MKKLTTPTICFLLAIVMLFSSCATIIHGSRQNITIQSLTKNSKIYVDEVDSGKDSILVRLKRNKNHVIAISKEGFETKIVHLEKHTKAYNIGGDAFWAYIIFGFTGYGAVWMIVDAATGSWNKFDHDVVVVELEKSK